MATNTAANEIALNDVLRNALDGLFVLDRERRFVLFSDGCERITGYGRGSVIGTQCHCHELTECRDEHGRSLSGALCPSLRVFNGEVPAVRQHMSVEHRDGHTVWVETTYSPMHGKDGSIECVVGFLRDVSDSREGLGASTMGTTSQSNRQSTYAGGGGSDAQAGDRPLDDILNSIEKREILTALRRANGQRTLAAQLLRISRSRLYRRMEALGIDPRKLGPGSEA